jgi:hypothetical protein
MTHRYGDWLPAPSRYIPSGTPEDGRKDRPNHAECYAKIK